MENRKRKIRERKKRAAALLMAAVMSANLAVVSPAAAWAADPVQTPGGEPTPAAEDVKIVNVELENKDSLDENMGFYPGNEYTFTCTLENGTGTEDIVWAISDPSLVGITIREDEDDQTKATLSIAENANVDAKFKLAVSLNGVDESQVESEEITVGSIGSLDIGSLTAGTADGTALEIRTVEGSEGYWIRSESVVINLADENTGYDQYRAADSSQLADAGWTAIPTAGIPVSGTMKSIQFRNSKTTQISNALILSCDGTAPAVSVQAKPAGESWTTGQSYMVTADDSQGCGVASIYYVTVTDGQESDKVEIVDGTVTFSAQEDAGRQLRFYAVDKLGNVSPQGETYTVNDIDTTIPELTITHGSEEVLEESYTFSNDDIKNRENIFTIEASDIPSGLQSVQYSDNNGADWKAVEDINLGNLAPGESAVGHVTVTITDESTAGNYIYKVKAVDNAGNETVQDINVLYDPAAPTITAKLPDDATSAGWISESIWNKDNPLNISVTASDTDSGIADAEYRYGIGSIPEDAEWTKLDLDESGAAELNIKDILALDGVYTFQFRTTDNAGNTSAVAEVPVWLDTTAPKAEFKEYVNAIEVVKGETTEYWFNNDNKDNGDGKAVFSASDVTEGVNTVSGIKEASYRIKTEEGVGKDVTVDAATGTIEVQPEYKDDKEGTVNYVLTVTDTAGNSSETEFTVNWDTTLPQEISIHISDGISPDGIWEFITDGWDRVKEFITGQKTVYLDVYAEDAGTGIQSMTCKYETADGAEPVELSRENAGITQDGNTTVYHFTGKAEINGETDAKILSVTATDYAQNTTTVTSPEDQEPRFIIDNTAPKLEVDIAAPVHTEEDGVAYYDAAPEMKFTLKEDHFLKDGVEIYDNTNNTDDNHYGNATEDVTIIKSKYNGDDEETNTDHIPWTQESSGTYTATLTFEPGYKYTVSYKMTDGAGNAMTVGENGSENTYEYTFAIDTQEPQGNVTIDGDTFITDTTSQTAYYYYNGKDEDGQEDEITAIAKIKEDMFFSEDVEYAVEYAAPGEEEYQAVESAGDEWTTAQTDVYENQYTLSEDGNYRFSLDYTDRANHGMTRLGEEKNDRNNKKYDGEDRPEQIIVVDKTAPEVEISYSESNKEYTENPGNDNEKKVKYFGSAPELTVTVTDFNFNPENVNVNISSSDIPYGKTVSVDTAENIAKYFKNPDNWIHEMKNDEYVHTAVYRFSEEARYDLAIDVSDWAGNKANTVTDTFVIDETDPVFDSITVDVYKNGDDSEKADSILPNEERSYYNADHVQLTLTVTEHNFYTEALENVMAESEFITVDSSGEDNPVKVGGENWSFQDYLADKDNWVRQCDEAGTPTDTYVLTVNISYESNYTVGSFQFTDMAGHKTDEQEKQRCFEFTLDRTAPEIKYKVDAFRTLLNYATFGYFGNEYITVSATVTDNISGVYGFDFKSEPEDGYENITVNADKTLAGEPKPSDTFTWKIDSDFKGYVFGTAKDYAGIAYGEYVNGSENPDTKKMGIILETADTHRNTSSIDFDYPEPNGNGFYRDDVTVDISAEDSYSGINHIAYGAETENVSDNYDPTFEKEKDVCYGFDTSVSLDKDRYYSNNIRVYADMEDNAGNTLSDQRTLKIDGEAPVISVTYDNNSVLNGDYYNAPRTATVTIQERNFDENRTQFVWTSTGGAPSISGWTHTGETHTAYVTFSADADYTFTVRSTDLADNTADYARVDEFTVDRTVPVIQVSYDNNNAQNGNYYNASRTATIRITEHNFNAADVQITGTAVENGSSVSFPGVSGWSSSGDVHTATINYSQDAHYTFDIAYTDLAGNAAADYQEDQFVVDQTRPALVVRGVEDESANNDDEIGFVLTASDNNFGTMEPKLTAVVRDENDEFTTVDIPLGEERVSGNDHSITKDNLEKDGIYTLTCSVTDMAGNTCDIATLEDSAGQVYGEKSLAGGEDTLLEFSVNRFGSTYRVILRPEDLNNNITNEKAENINVRIEEINVDELEESQTRFDLYNGLEAKAVQLTEGDNYEAGYAEGAGGWHMYTYTLGGENFVNDGNYQVGVYSVDKAGNESDSSLKEEAKIEFIVDRTNPELAINVESRHSYDQVERNIELNITELHLNDRGVEVLVNGKPLEMNKEITSSGNGQYEFTLGSGMNQTITVNCTDQAGNSSELSVDRVTVSTNIMVRAGAWILNNMMIFVVTVIILLLLIIGLIVWRVNEKNKRKVEVDDE